MVGDDLEFNTARRSRSSTFRGVRYDNYLEKIFGANKLVQAAGVYTGENGGYGPPERNSSFRRI